MTAVEVDPFDIPAVADACAEHLLEVGLAQRELWPGAWDGEPYTPGAPTCMLGAIGVVCGVRNVKSVEETLEVDVDPNEGDVAAFLAACTTSDIELMPAAEALHSLVGDVPRFNDADGRTVADAVQAFRDLAVKERPDEARQVAAPAREDVQHAHDG